MIYKYLLEIKYRIFFSFIAWSFILVNCYYFKETLLHIFMRFSSKPGDSCLFIFLTTDVTEVFITYIHLSSHVAKEIAIIFIFCHFFFFLSTGLHIFEYIYFKTVLIFLIFCWVILICALNNYIFPTSWNFFLKFQEYLSFQNLTFYFEAKLSEYLSFYESIYYLCNTICQTMFLFCIVLDLFKTNLLLVKKLRKIFYLFFFIFSTFLTPPEVTYQLIISICMIIIYELVIINFIFKNEITRTVIM